MRNLTTIVILSIFVTSCNKFNNDEKIKANFKKEGIELNQSTIFEKKLKQSDSIKIQNAKDEAKNMDLLYAKMVYKFGLTNASKHIYQIYLNNNYTSKEAIGNVIILHDRYIENRENQRIKSTRLNADEPTWVDENGNRYTADEIRRLRKNDPDHIYRTHGNPVHN